MSRRMWSFLILTVASCGVPIEQSAQPVPLDDVVFEVSPPSTELSGPIGPTVDESGSRAVVIYLIRDQALIGRARSTSVDYSAQDLLDLLAAGPIASDFLDDLSTGLNQTEPVVDSAEIVGDLVLVELSDSFLANSPPNQTLVLGQIVVTLISNLPIIGVQFTSGGQVIAVPDAAGKPVTEPVRRRDYAALLGN